MDISFKKKEITITLKEISVNNVNKFIIEYSLFLSTLDEGKDKTLRFIEDHCKVVEDKAPMMFTMMLFKHFKTEHHKHIKNIEFCFKSKKMYKLFNMVINMFPPKQPYETIMLIKPTSIQHEEI
tara:strand:+ start:4373 stop:4744 length:372 start_codon:yes stop_codon:yes gene_type:complete